MDISQLKWRIPSRTNPNVILVQQYKIHRLVCRAFNAPPPGEGQDVVDHINNDNLDNHSNNLRWTTQPENMRFRREQPARPIRKTPPPVSSQSVMTRSRPTWRNIGVYLNDTDLSNYEVCSQGVVRNIQRPNSPMTQRISSSGYYCLSLTDRNTGRSNVYMNHIMVAYVFHREPCNKEHPLVDHINQNRLDNRAVNLRWVNHSQNTQAAIGVRIRRTDTVNEDVVEYASIGECMRHNPISDFPGLNHHISGSVEPRDYDEIRL